MKVLHFTKTDLIDLPSCFLDPKGNFIMNDGEIEVGVHKALAGEILNTVYGEDYDLEHYHEIHDGRTYTYEYLEEVLGYFRYSHWIGQYGVFNGEMGKITHAQKLAIRQFCQINGANWKTVLRL